MRTEAVCSELAAEREAATITGVCVCVAEIQRQAGSGKAVEWKKGKASGSSEWSCWPGEVGGGGLSGRGQLRWLA